MFKLGSRRLPPSDRIHATSVGLAAVAAGLLGMAALLQAGCAPQTDLHGPDGTGDPAGAGTAAGALIEPRAGSTDVPWNLAAISVRVPAALAMDAAPFRLRSTA